MGPQLPRSRKMVGQGGEGQQGSGGANLQGVLEVASPHAEAHNSVKHLAVWVAAAIVELP